jgi:hypothetical protein
VLGLLLAAPAWTAREVQAAGAAPQVRWTGTRISIELAGPAPLAELLERVADVTGVSILLRGDGGSIGPLVVHEVPLTEVLETITAGHGLVMRFAAATASGAPPRPAEVWVLSGGQAAPRAYRPSTPRRSSKPGLKDSPAGRMAAKMEQIKVWSLANRGNAGTEQLGQILATDKDPARREVAVRTLALVGGDAAVRVLARGLYDPNSRVRLQTIHSIRKLKDAGALSDLKAAAALERDPRVRQAMRWALDKPS